MIECCSRISVLVKWISLMAAGLNLGCTSVWPGDMAGSQAKPGASQAKPRVGVFPIVTSVNLFKVDLPTAAAVGLGEDSALTYGPGSGLAFLERRNEHPRFLYVTDRGPNAEATASQVKAFGKDAKVFPAPGFMPRFGILEAVGDGSRFTADAGKPMVWQGRALLGVPPGKVPDPSSGARLEIALNRSGQILKPTSLGIDTEAIALGRNGLIYVSEEYGPSILEVEQASGRVVSWWSPGHGLPDVFARRQLNRGFEGLATTPSGDLVALLQSPIENQVTTAKRERPPPAEKGSKKEFEPFIRGIQIHKSMPLREIRVPIADRDTPFNEWGDAKVGDLAAIDDNAFLMILQGKLKGGGRDAYLVLAIVQGSCGDSSENLPCVSLVTKDIARLSALKWQHEKTEGLALVAPNEVAIINDNDFGLGAGGVADPTELLRVVFDRDFETMVAEFRRQAF